MQSLPGCEGVTRNFGHELIGVVRGVMRELVVDGRGQAAYAPEMMVRVLLYGYA